MPVPHHSLFTGRMLFLPPNQQYQSMESNNVFLITVSINVSLASMFAQHVLPSRRKLHAIHCYGCWVKHMKWRLRSRKCSPRNSWLLSISWTLNVAFFRKLYNWNTKHSHVLHATIRLLFVSTHCLHFPALCRNWFQQLYFHFSHKTTGQSINTIKSPEDVPDQLFSGPKCKRHHKKFEPKLWMWKPKSANQCQKYIDMFRDKVDKKYK